ncbi:MAG: DAK2 domain-containing protein, partial [Oscillospiraceae bacterium]|nr:DAK2 domain-containing protein [Oscillospiraceae bacterium]
MITGAIFRDAVISASNNINNNKKEVNALNVFPVPDGDTGTNMAMTMAAAAREVAHIDDFAPVSVVASAAANALLRGARGNSGVILSLIFRGIAKGLKGCQQANGANMAAALMLGVDSAYKAVMKPTEGTILTVVRIAAQDATEMALDTDIRFAQVWEEVCKSAKETLDKTPSMLPVLKKAGVVDAGGQGLVCIFEGMRSVFVDDIMIESEDDGVSSQQETVIKTAVVDADIEFGYCTEFLVDKPDDKEQDATRLRAYLESIGDCVVVVDDDEIIKVHVHSNEPGSAIQEGLKFGALMNIKIENMRQQHQNAVWGAAQDVEQNIPLEKAEPENVY